MTKMKVSEGPKSTYGGSLAPASKLGCVFLSVAFILSKCVLHQSPSMIPPQAFGLISWRLSGYLRGRFLFKVTWVDLATAHTGYYPAPGTPVGFGNAGHRTSVHADLFQLQWLGRPEAMTDVVKGNRYNAGVLMLYHFLSEQTINLIFALLAVNSHITWRKVNIYKL